jgi:hypothetical protein
MNDTTLQSLDARLPKHRGLYYGGAWHDSNARREITVIAPATGDPLGAVADAISR